MKPHRLSAVSETEDSACGLFNALAALKSPAEAKLFLEDLCTPAEIQAMVDRWRVVALLKTGKPYRQIYEETGVSVTTVGRVARCIMLGEGGYNLIYERLEKKANENNSKTQNRDSKKRPA